MGRKISHDSSYMAVRHTRVPNLASDHAEHQGPFASCFSLYRFLLKYPIVLSRVVASIYWEFRQWVS